MDGTGSHPNQVRPLRETVESDPAYEFADETPIDDETWDDESEQDETTVDEDERLVPLDADEFRETDED